MNVRIPPRYRLPAVVLAAWVVMLLTPTAAITCMIYLCAAGFCVEFARSREHVLRGGLALVEGCIFHYTLIKVGTASGVYYTGVGIVWIAVATLVLGLLLAWGTRRFSRFSRMAAGALVAYLCGAAMGLAGA